MFRYYHLFNRGVEKRIIFNSDKDRRRFVDSLRLARLKKSPKLSWLKRQLRIGRITPPDLEKLEDEYGPPLLDIIAYCLMPNHFHFQVKESVRGGMSKFFRKLGTSYAMYFNIKYQRTGRLFESQYKAVLIENDEQLIHLSRYIHSNPLVSSKIELRPNQLKNYPSTSLPDYLGTRHQRFCNPTEVMGFFKSPKKYWEFLKGNLGKDEVLPFDLVID